MSTITTPTGREEAWRFTPLNRLGGLHDGSAANTGTLSFVMSGEAIGEHQSLPAIDSRVLPKDETTDAVALHARARVENVDFIEIPSESSGIVRIVRNGLGGSLFARTLITVGKHSKVSIVMENFGDISLAEEVELRIADEAIVQFISTQEWSPTAVHVARHRFELGRNALLAATHFTMGGSVVRISPRVDYLANGGSAELNGLYFANTGQHLEHRLHVEHDVSHCKSRVTYKGALDGEGAHTVWIGDVAIRAVAEGTDTYELNRNLVLSDHARADSVPNLEIETGEIVGAGHASATGRFDDEQLFYLQSRGIPEHEARKLVVRGFFAELITKIDIADLEERLLGVIDDALEASNA
ncbi:unannotated protein [freshwater metagenome]|uniref:Unannotated protein n=1 Tax=freshwater metagenome TaxID=449393 RepID=A0A6J7T789_9ZZZZ|nr:Fe-S cluster assembly protein SufD [Actinomycetota bacterium]